MSLHAYEQSQNQALRQVSFYALIMAAMRKADTENLAALQREFPRVWEELTQRYNAPGGLLPGENGEG